MVCWISILTQKKGKNMTPELTKSLHDEFSDILIKDGKSILRGGDFEFRDGWYKIIHKFLSTMNLLLKDLRVVYSDCKVDVDFIIMKEKFGTLQIQGFYISGVPKEYVSVVHAIVEQYENHSMNTCEVTGEYGRTRNDLHWVQTLCDSEYEKVKRERGIRVNVISNCKSCGSKIINHSKVLD